MESHGDWVPCTICSDKKTIVVYDSSDGSGNDTDIKPTDTKPTKSKRLCLDQSVEGGGKYAGKSTAAAAPVGVSDDPATIKRGAAMELLVQHESCRPGYLDEKGNLVGTFRTTVEKHTTVYVMNDTPADRLVIRMCVPIWEKGVASWLDQMTYYEWFEKMMNLKRLSSAEDKSDFIIAAPQRPFKTDPDSGDGGGSGMNFKRGPDSGDGGGSGMNFKRGPGSGDVGGSGMNFKRGPDSGDGGGSGMNFKRGPDSGDGVGSGMNFKRGPGSGDGGGSGMNFKRGPDSGDAGGSGMNFKRGPGSGDGGGSGMNFKRGPDSGDGGGSGMNFKRGPG
jgi:hypothetical protein